MERLERLQETVGKFIENANHALQFADGMFKTCLNHELSNYCFIWDEIQKAKSEVQKKD